MNIVLLSDTDFVDENRAVISGRRFEHLCKVLNVKQGDTVKAGLVNGLTGCAEVESLHSDKCTLTVKLDSPPPKALPCTLVLAMPRPKTLKRALETAITMGVKNIFIIGSFRVEKSYWSSPVLSDEYLHNLSMLALEQACDTVLPQIKIRKRFRPFTEDELPLISQGARAIVAHPYTPSFSMPIGECEEGGSCECIDSLLHGKMGNVVLIIGPEGGFIPFEINLLEKQGCITVSFGNRILRVEQAVPAILAKLF